MRGDIDRERRLPTRRIEGVQLVSGSKPDLLAVHSRCRHQERVHTHGRFRPLIDSCFHPRDSGVERGVTRSSWIQSRAGSSNDEVARRQTTAPCQLPQASRVPAARCAGWLQAQAPGLSPTTTHRRRGRRAPLRAPLRRAAPVKRARGLEPHSPVFRIACCNYRTKCIDCRPEFCHEVL